MRHCRNALVTLLLLLVLPGVAVAAESPDAVLEEESRALRQQVMETDGFIVRMERYRQYSDGIQELMALIEPVRPILNEIENLGPYVDLGLLDMLTQMDPDLAALEPIFEGIVTANQSLDTLAALGRDMGDVSADLDLLLSKPILSLDDMTRLRASIPSGQETLANAAQSYQRVRPSLDQAVVRLQELRVQLEHRMKDMNRLLGNNDLSREMQAALELVFGGIIEIKTNLDAMADRVPDDIETLSQLQTSLVSAEAHHAFAVASQMIDDGQIEDAEVALQMLVDVYPETTWAGEASALLESGLEPDVLRDPATSGGPGLGWLLLVMGGMVAGATAFVFWSRRRESA